jgi:uncharacterized membrane protein
MIRIFRNPAWASAFLASFILIGIASNGSFTPYSFWLDELATASMFQHGRTLWYSLIHEYHPPLYFVFVWLWGNIAGVNEISLRFPSLLFAAGAMIVMIRFVLIFSRKELIWPLLAAALLGTLPNFAFAAQEARPYGLTLFTSTLFTTNALSVNQFARTKSFLFSPVMYLVSAILLSLSHYFGLLLVLIFTFWNLILGAARFRWLNLMAVAGSLVWPIVHFLQRTISVDAGVLAFDRPFPVLGTLRVMLVACPFAILFLPLLPTIIRNSFPLFSSDEPQEPSALRTSFFVFVTFLSLMIFLDFFKNVSGVRYFIAFIPLTVLLFLYSCQAFFENVRSRSLKISFLGLIIILLSAQTINAYERLALKSTPDQNWRGLAEAVRLSGICNSGCYTLGPTEWLDFYFHDIKLNKQDEVYSSNPSSFKLANPLLGFHNQAASISPLLSANPGSFCLEPTQALALSTFIIVPKSMHTLISNRSGLVPCSHPG